ncbi:hypothetical protein ACFHW2_07405 [Actinomadura sp. LOL_016]|uniref:hypothetical protein n=1 Tax=unclassified Actinomadura TaxID=2626254 RepID=UPI003A813AF3
MPRRHDGTAPPAPSHDVRPPVSGSPIPPEAPTSPIVHGPPPGWTSEASGTSGARPPGEGAGTYRAGGVHGDDPAATRQDEPAFAARDERPLAPRQEEPASTTGPVGTRETSGVQVRLGSRGGRGRGRGERARAEQAADVGSRPGRRRGKGRRAGLVAAGVVALAGLVMGGVVLSSGTREDGAGQAALGGGGERPNGTASVALPEAGRPVEVGTADGSRYRIAAVTAGVGDETMASALPAPPSGTSYPYIEYLLTNPKDEKVLLDFPGDVFVKADLVASDARGRCMPQAGVPEDMCTPPTESRVVKALAGGELLPGDGGDKWMPPGSSYLVRATVTVPVDRRIDGTDLGLYVWKQLYVSDQLARPAPFPR